MTNRTTPKNIYFMNNFFRMEILLNKLMKRENTISSSKEKLKMYILINYIITS